MVFFYSFCFIFCFFSMRLISLLLSYFTVHLITHKRLLLERPVSQLSGVKKDFNYLSWFIFYNFLCSKSQKIAEQFLTILHTVRKENFFRLFLRSGSRYLNISTELIQHIHSYYLTKKIQINVHC